MNKNRISIAILSVMLVLLVGGRYFLPNSESISRAQNQETEGAQTNAAAADEERFRNIQELRFTGASETQENPWGTTAGKMDMGDIGTCILLTPGTEADFQLNAKGASALRFSWRIHPQVSSSSDGADITVEIYSAEQKTPVKQETYTVRPKDDWTLTELEIPVEDAKEDLTVKLICPHTDNESADWIVIREVSAK